MPEKPVRSPNLFKVGVVGAGWVAADRHVPALLRIPDVRLAAVCDSKVGRAATLAKAGDADTIATESLDDLIATRPDLVSVCTPPFAHRDTAVRLLDAGIPVFLEKPMAMNESEALDIVEASKRSGKLVCVCHNFLFSRSMKRLTNFVTSGKSGPILQIVALQASSPRRRLPSWYGSLPGGLLFDESPHLLYLIHSLIGQADIVALHAKANPDGSEQPIRSIQVIMTSQSTPVTISMNFSSPISEWHLIVICERAVLAVDLFRDVSVVLRSDGAHKAVDILRTSGSAIFQHGRGVALSGSRVVAGLQDWGHSSLIASMVSAVKQGGPSPVSVEDSLRVVRSLDQLVADFR